MTKPIVYRRRGTAIIETQNGILLVSHKDSYFTPGGGAESNESRDDAVVREVREETGLIVTKTKYLFSIDGNPHNDPDKIEINQHKVFLVKVKGIARPNQEIKRFGFYPNRSITLTETTKRILAHYQKYKREHVMFRLFFSKFWKNKIKVQKS